jgi:D-serine deaminase-like pyridoxal phosphate-dependent protein
MNPKRRLLLTAAVVAPIAYLAAKRPAKHGGAHDDYFRALQKALAEAELFRPTLVIDRERFMANVARLKAHLPKNKRYRIVAKSLPSMPMIKEISAATGSKLLMVFHEPHLHACAADMPDAELLLGKPMPVGMAHRFLARVKPGAFDAARQIEWLVDTPQRIAEYRDLAKARAGASPARDRPAMRLNLELDVGLHRGGFRTAQDVADAIKAIRAEPALSFSGFMGYEAHAAKMPAAFGGVQGALDAAWAFYRECVEAAQQVMGADFKPDALTLNMGGSNTYEYYDESSPGNELAVGSGLVKPTDFDTRGLTDHVPAAFIATPVLKVLDRTVFPGPEAISSLIRAWDPNSQRTFLIYGGYWLADLVSPPGLKRNILDFHSTNQDWLTGSNDVQLGVGDFVFLRPNQSEFVLLQFGDLAVYDKGRITGAWPVFNESGDV